MALKKSEPQDTESSAEEEEEDAEEAGDEGESGSSSEEDEFDSEDDRVNIIPGEEILVDNLLQATAANDTSSESDEDNDTTLVPMKPVAAASPQTQQNVRTFNSDVESEYETESSSESAGLSQDPARDMVLGTSRELKAAVPFSRKKVQGALTDGRTKEIDQVAKKGKDKVVKQQQKDHISGKSEDLRTSKEESQSVEDDKPTGLQSAKRKLGSLQHFGTDSEESVPISKKKKDAEVVHSVQKSASRDKAVNTPSSDSAVDDLKKRKGIDRAKPLHDLGKEITRKALHIPNTKVNGSVDVFDSKLSSPVHEPNQDKNANNSAATRPASASKQKKLPHIWSIDQEIILLLEVLDRVKMGLEVPTKRTDDFWFTLSGILQEKLGVEFTKEQLSEKVRRFKQRYQSMVQRIKDLQEAKKPFKHKNSDEQRLFDLMSQLWGRAEMVTLEGHQQEAPHEARPASCKPEQVARGESKAMNVNSSITRHTVIVNKEENVGNGAVNKANAVVASSPKIDHKIVAKADKRPVVSNTPTDVATLPSNYAQSLLEDKVQAMLHDLQEWSKRSLEEWMNKVYIVIEDSTRKFEGQWRRLSWMGTAGGGLPPRICDLMDFPIALGDEGLQQQWCDLRLQELNVHVQRLELMRRECELKQEQIKMQLQEKSRK